MLLGALLNSGPRGFKSCRINYVFIKNNLNVSGRYTAICSTEVHGFDSSFYLERFILDISHQGPFKCYVTHMGVGGGGETFPEKSITKV